jgi:hypothetical protein
MRVSIMVGKLNSNSYSYQIYIGEDHVFNFQVSGEE